VVVQYLDAPLNDNFVDSLTVGAPNSNAAGAWTGSPYGWDIINAGNILGTKEPGEPAHAGIQGGASVWFSWTPQADGPVVLETAGSDLDTVLAVYTGDSLAGLVPVASNDDNGGPFSRVSFTAKAGTTYRIAVDGKDGSRSRQGIRVSMRYSPPSNDNYFLPKILPNSGPWPTHDTNAGATLQAIEKSLGATGGHSIWYSWKPNASAQTTITTWRNGTDVLSDFAMVMTVYSTTGFGRSLKLTPVTSYPKRLGASGGFAGKYAAVTFNAVSGVRYLIRIDGQRGAVGRVALTR
jgi:hypothetical protein